MMNPRRHTVKTDVNQKAPEYALRASATIIAKMTGTDFGNDAIGKIMQKYDADGNGKFDLNEVRGIATDVLTQKAGKKAYKGVAIASFFLLILAIAAIFGVTFAAGEMLKDTEAKDSTLATRDGSVLKTSPATHAMPLLVAPVLELAQLEQMQTITLSYLDPANNGTKVQAVLSLTGAKKVSDTRVSFDVDSKWVELVEIWDGEVYVVLPDGARRAVCEADVTCSALKVDESADADALLEKAAAALEAAGHGEKTAARERRLEECDWDPDDSSWSYDSWATANTAATMQCTVETATDKDDYMLKSEHLPKLRMICLNSGGGHPAHWCDVEKVCIDQMGGTEDASWQYDADYESACAAAVEAAETADETADMYYDSGRRLDDSYYDDSWATANTDTTCTMLKADHEDLYMLKSEHLTKAGEVCEARGFNIWCPNLAGYEGPPACDVKNHEEPDFVPCTVYDAGGFGDDTGGFGGDAFGDDTGGFDGFR